MLINLLLLSMCQIFGLLGRRLANAKRFALRTQDIFRYLTGFSISNYPLLDCIEIVFKDCE